MIDQLTVFVENEEGRLASVCRAIADAGINMYALFLADTQDFGIARIFCDTPNAAAAALREKGYRAKVIPVVGVQVPNKPGGLAELLEFIDAQSVNIEYGYCFSAKDDFAIDVLKLSDDNIEAKLKEAGYRLVLGEEIYEID